VIPLILKTQGPGEGWSTGKIKRKAKSSNIRMSEATTQILEMGGTLATLGLVVIYGTHD
jgi:hypothetical protein